MANVNIKFNGKDYLLSCDDGQEESLKKLTSFLDKKYSELKNKLGNIGENKLLLITSIKLIDEHFDLRKRISEQKNKLDELSKKFIELRSLAFKYDGTRMYVTGNETEVVQQFTLSTPWDVTSATKDSTESPALTGKEGKPRSIQFNSDGTIFYIGGNGTDSIHKYTLSTPWDVSTLEFSQSYSFSAQVSSSGNSIMAGFIFTANFTLFVCSPPIRCNFKLLLVNFISLHFSIAS